MAGEKCKKCRTVMEIEDPNVKYVLKLVCPKCDWFTFRPNYKEIENT